MSARTLYNRFGGVKLTLYHSPIPAGTHDVVLEYRPSSFRISLAVAFLGAVFTVAVARSLRST